MKLNDCDQDILRNINLPVRFSIVMTCYSTADVVVYKRLIFISDILRISDIRGNDHPSGQTHNTHTVYCKCAHVQKQHQM